MILTKAFKASKINKPQRSYQANNLIAAFVGQLKIQMQQKRVKKFQKGKL